jgi:membrane protease YdiL (CAAX protease family)
MLNEKPPLYQLFVSVLIVLGAGMVLFAVFLAAGMFIFGTDLALLENPGEAVTNKQTGFLKYLLISQHISLFIVPAIILMIKLKPADQRAFADMKRLHISDIAFVIVLAFCLFPVTIITGQLNAEMHFPEWLSGIEQWMREKEDSAGRLFEIVMTPDTVWLLILNVFMIAVLPAIGEELIFRGVFQKIFYKLFRSGHLAVWVTAIIFSTMHFQFYGFLPRLILGLVFGYLFFWSGNLWLPVISHFVNNAVPTIGAYIQKSGDSGITENIPLWKQIIGLALPLLLCIIILMYFRDKYLKGSSESLNETKSSA